MLLTVQTYGVEYTPLVCAGTLGARASVTALSPGAYGVFGVSQVSTIPRFLTAGTTRSRYPSLPAANRLWRTNFHFRRAAHRLLETPQLASFHRTALGRDPDNPRFPTIPQGTYMHPGPIKSLDFCPWGRMGRMGPGAHGEGGKNGGGSFGRGANGTASRSCRLGLCI